MVEQKRLFPDSVPNIGVSCPEPRLWVRRLTIWERPGQLLREISLRRGLNIIWSPDPGAQAAAIGSDQGIGHGAGKTLLCRFLRYCLGEDTFADDELRAQITAAFPEGLVGAEVVVDGVTWGVVRTLESPRRTLVAEGRLPEELIGAIGEERTGMAPLLDVIQSRFLSAQLPHLAGGKVWPFVLAWLARDQECRFSHPLEWRHARIDSNSSVLGMAREQILLVVRALLGAVAKAEVEVKEDLKRAADTKRRGEGDVLYFDRAFRERGQELSEALGLDPSLLMTDSLATAAMLRLAQERLRAVEERAIAEDVVPELGSLREDLHNLDVQIAVIRTKSEQTAGLIDIQREQIKALNGERANLDAQAIKSRLGTLCPVCNVPIDDALARGCGISHVRPDLAQIANEKKNTAEAIANANAAIASYKAQIVEHRAILEELENKARTLRNQIDHAEQNARDARLSRYHELVKAARLVEDTRRLVTLDAERVRARERIKKATQEEGRLRESGQEHRRKSSSVLQRLEELFRHIAKGVLGSDTSAHVTLSGPNLRIEVDAGGTAMESLKVIVFDIAALLMSVEGRADIPAFLVHDSPREADLGLSIYHKYLRVARSLEDLGELPPFQYIVTTTTEPPEELRVSPYLVLKLSGSIDEDRLLKKALR